ncbi:hypothetical protein DFJ77DRAFT_539002 [Powellomyces hirtus]|nr:hypothetical protein DFJ77DRAFT_539002 [Powellomyces hirtus]
MKDMNDVMQHKRDVQTNFDQASIKLDTRPNSDAAVLHVLNSQSEARGGDTSAVVITTKRKDRTCKDNRERDRMRVRKMELSSGDAAKSAIPDRPRQESRMNVVLSVLGQESSASSVLIVVVAIILAAVVKVCACAIFSGQSTEKEVLSDVGHDDGAGMYLRREIIKVFKQSVATSRGGCEHASMHILNKDGWNEFDRQASMKNKAYPQPDTYGLELSRTVARVTANKGVIKGSEAQSDARLPTMPLRAVKGHCWSWKRKMQAEEE